MGVLYIVATPIGNLKDISLRAIEVLKEADLILCEDTRETRKLLDYYDIDKPVDSYHQHSKLKKVDNIIQMLKEGKNLALVSDAGTPGISDPGNLLVAQVSSLGIKIVPIPGATAVITAASISGFPMDRFVFMGFPPAKKKRLKYFEEVLDSRYPVVFYEAPYRIVKSLQDLQSVTSKGKSQVVVCRELTKKFETIYRGTASEVLAEIQSGPVKGEFVVIVCGNKKDRSIPA